jgi:hypothetical protein
MDDSPHSHRSTRGRTDIRRHKPFVFEISLKLFLQTPNMVPSRYKITEEKNVRTMTNY